MPSFIVLTIILPLVGAVGMLGLSLVSRIRPHTHYIALVALGLTIILVLTFRWRVPIEEVPTLWQPSLLLGGTPTLQSEATTQPLALVLALTTFSALIVELSRTDNPQPWRTAALLGLLAAGFATLWAANPLTLVISWASYDLLLAVGHIAAGGSQRIAIRGLIFGSLATLLLWGGTLASGDGESSVLWSLMSLNNAQLTLWAAAGILRLWMYPFHLSAPDELGAVPSLAAFLLSPVTGWVLWLHLAGVNGGSLPGSTWVLTLAAITLTLGYFLAWSCRSPRCIVPWTAMGATGAALLAAGLAGESAVAVIVASSVAWVLGVTVLFLTDGLRQEAPWWSIPALIGALALLGFPFTLGFTQQATLLGGITGEVHLWWGGAFFLGNLFLVPSLVRWLLTPSSHALSNHPWLLTARGIGTGLPALLLIVAGFYSPLLIGEAPSFSLGALFALPGLAGWLLWALSLACGGALAWQEENVRSKMELLLGAIHDLLRLDWLYNVLVGAMDRGLNVLRAADEVVRGAGALLWSWLLFLLILLVWSSL